MSLTQGVRHVDPADPGRPVTDWLLDHVPLGPGIRGLEIAAGSATVTLAAAARAPEGFYVCTDLHVGGLLEAATYLTANATVSDGPSGRTPSVTLLAADMHRLPFSDGAFDAALCRFGFMYASNLTAALGEARRVLRSGGRLAFAVWAASEHNPWQSHLDEALTAFGVEDRSVERRSGGMFGLGDALTLQRQLEEVGFSVVERTAIELPRQYRAFEEYWTREVAVGVSRPERLRALDPQALTAFSERLQAALLPYREDEGYRIPGLTLALSALA